MTDRPAPQDPASESEPKPRSRGSRTGGRPLHRRVTSLPWLARAAAVGLSGVSVGFVLLFLVVLDGGGELVLVTMPLPMRLVLALPALVVVLALATAVGAILAWRHRYWSPAARVHHTILAVLGLAFAWQLLELGLVAI